MLRIFYVLLLCVGLSSAVQVSAQELDSLQYLLPEVDAVDASLPSVVTSAVPLRSVTADDVRRLGFAGVSDA